MFLWALAFPQLQFQKLDCVPHGLLCAVVLMLCQQRSSETLNPKPYTSSLASRERHRAQKTGCLEGPSRRIRAPLQQDQSSPGCWST
jgi:hypothetical protein